MKPFSLLISVQLTITILVQLAFSQAAHQPKEYKIYFGDLHAHTSYSDGKGKPKQAYEQAKNSGRADFLAITDHHYALSSGEWEDTKRQASAITDNTFVGIASIEKTHTTGHWNLFDTKVNSKGKITTLPKVYEDLLSQKAKNPNLIAMFNHPLYSNNQGAIDNYQSWAHRTDELDALHTMVEVGRSNGPESSWQMALDKGWHLAPTNTSDTHSANWITGYEHRTGVLVESLTETNIYDALRNMRCYATEDRNLQVRYSINGKVMGSLLAEPSSLDVEITVEDPDNSSSGDKITKVELIKERGQTEQSKSFNDHKVEWKFTLSPNSKYYYVRIKQSDGDDAWSAPIWTSGQSSPITTVKPNRMNFGKITRITMVKINGQKVRTFTPTEFKSVDWTHYSSSLYLFIFENSRKEVIIKKLLPNSSSKNFLLLDRN